MYAYLAAFSVKGSTAFNEIIIVFEVIFFISLCLNFITDYKEEGSNSPVRDASLISMKYLNSRFVWDFLPLIPLTIFDLGYESFHHFYLIKIIRLDTGLRLFNVQIIMAKVKLIMKAHLEDIVENDPILAEDQDSDQNKITMMINIGFAIKILKLMVIIANITYFFGLFWYIFCDIALDIQFSIAESDQFHQHAV